jgi:hypothetical protein
MKRILFIMLLVLLIFSISAYSQDTKKIKQNYTTSGIIKENYSPKIKKDSIKRKLLLNGEYKIETGDAVKLKNGKFKRGSAGDDNYVDVTFKNFSLGNIDNEGAEDAAVILSANYGGSGSFYQLFAVINREGQFQQKGEPIVLGDRVIINSIIIKNRIIIIDMTTQGPKDALCCPTKREIVKYKLTGNNLTRLK